jgi:DNA-binding Xre family transcriptional regulator
MISYAKLWRLLNKRGYSPRDIILLASISESTYQKLVKNDTVRMDVLKRVCDALNVDIGDVCSFHPY